LRKWDFRERTTTLRVKQKIRITVTKEKYVSLGGTALHGAAWCPRCAAVTTMLTPDQAAALADVNTRQIFRWLEAGGLHYVETESPSPLVCLASLPCDAGVNDSPADDALVALARGVLHSTRKVKQDGQLG
jgi:hypothetical protein